MISVLWHLSCGCLEILLGMSFEKSAKFPFVDSKSVENVLLILDCARSLVSVTCFLHSFQSARSGCTHEYFFLRKYMPVLRFCFKCNAGDDDCFYYHSWRNNVVIAFGTLSSFLT